MPKKVNGQLDCSIEFVSLIKCDKYLKYYAYQGIINEDDWKDESNFTLDDVFYMLDRLRKRIEQPDKFSEEEINNAQFSYDKICEKARPWYAKYLKLIKEGEKLDIRSKNFKGPTL